MNTVLVGSLGGISSVAHKYLIESETISCPTNNQKNSWLTNKMANTSLVKIQIPD